MIQNSKSGFLKISKSLLLAAVWIWGTTQGQAQHTLGVTWSPPAEDLPFLRQLERFESAGISIIEVDRILSSEKIRVIREKQVEVFVQLPIRFPVENTFLNPGSNVVQSIQEYLSAYTPWQDIAAYGLFEYGQIRSEVFRQAGGRQLEALKRATDRPVYYKSWDENTTAISGSSDFTIHRVKVSPGFEKTRLQPGGRQALLYDPVPELYLGRKPLKWFLEETRNIPGLRLFFDAGWLIEILDRHPELTTILNDYAGSEDALFPVSDETYIPSTHSWIILILLLIWGTFALNFNFGPVYRKSVFRYFHSQKFFVEDVMQRHMRTAAPGILILMQHSLLGGIFFYTLFNSFFSELGMEALAYHYPNLLVLGNTSLSIFLMGFLLILLLEIFLVFWLFLPNFRESSISQVITLCSWPLQINLIITTIMVTLFITGSYNGAAVLGIIFLIVMIYSFLSASRYLGKYRSKNEFWYLLGTSVLFIAALTGIIILVFTNDFLINVVALAASIP